LIEPVWRLPLVAPKAESLERIRVCWKNLGLWKGWPLPQLAQQIEELFRISAGEV